MSSANANLSNAKKSLTLAKINPIAVSFDKDKIEVINYTKDSVKFSAENGFSEISAYDNKIVEKNGETRRVNPKTNKLWRTVSVPKGLMHNIKVDDKSDR